MPKITNVEVSGLERSIKTAKYPKTVDIESLNTELTKGIQACSSCGTGEGHDNFLKGIVVHFDMTFSNKAWVEAERYHFLEFVSSQSTMHKAANFDLWLQFNDYVDPVIVLRVEDIRDEYIANKTPENFLRLVYNIPAGFELTAGMVTNYQQLKTIYQQRRHHRLPDWQVFCNWIETLPMFIELTQKESINGT